jgi:hypothetical protein
MEVVFYRVSTNFRTTVNPFSTCQRSSLLESDGKKFFVQSGSTIFTPSEDPDQRI